MPAWRSARSLQENFRPGLSRGTAEQGGCASSSPHCLKRWRAIFCGRAIFFRAKCASLGTNFGDQIWFPKWEPPISFPFKTRHFLVPEIGTQFREKINPPGGKFVQRGVRGVAVVELLQRVSCGWEANLADKPRRNLCENVSGRWPRDFFH